MQEIRTSQRSKSALKAAPPEPVKRPPDPLLGELVDLDGLALSAAEDRPPDRLPSLRLTGGPMPSEAERAERVRRDVAERLGLPVAGPDGEVA